MNDVNEMFREFANSFVSVKMRDGSVLEGTIVTIDNYLNITLDTADGIRSLKGGNITYISAPE